MTRDYILSMIGTYIARQQLACEAMAELRPDKVATARFVGRREISFEEVLDLAEQYKDAPYNGFWNRHGNWKYSIHGGGCRLTNIETGEPLDWDAPDREVFDLYFFATWLMWVTKQEQQARDITEAVIKPIIAELEADGYLTRVANSNTNRFRLKEFDENDQPDKHSV